MLLLDTNVLSALIAPTMPTPVGVWLEGRQQEQFVTAAVCEAEILAGIAVMPAGARRLALEAAAREMFAREFAGRILAFDRPVAAAYARLFAKLRQLGRPVPPIDLMIAATALAHGADIATRNVRHFVDTGLTVIDPWSV